ncbi:MAG: RsbRD N-terminal domain-containing protein [Desulfobacterales bacterium]|jgi:hypothetical protein|nr:RsbRD N-terminal domain-containing protein [Desulfobacteraceae bacterium]MBT4363076.1 RsbRD N-terminal domain-containing protein [Desulfobacteraceae bacterium]MBT7084882.1 RsbRD N-terminal domain-containing protein [Desulfobacterales bacterium]MBT7698280.1 RsbRD N-terminal domain-containing protein [Desulfobacterales bacterium]
MLLNKLLEHKKKEIVKKWFEIIASTYPNDTAGFLKKEKDSFANPVGSTNIQGLGAVLDELINGPDRETITSFLDPIIRIRAVQKFTPSEAVSFTISLKKIIRDTLAREIVEQNLEKDILEFESKIDDLCLIAFDIFMGCREQIYKYKANHVKDRTLKLLQKADLLCEVPDMDSDITPRNF